MLLSDEAQFRPSTSKHSGTLWSQGSHMFFLNHISTSGLFSKNDGPVGMGQGSKYEVIMPSKLVDAGKLDCSVSQSGL
jgi:hypothetical protein